MTSQLRRGWGQGFCDGGIKAYFSKTYDNGGCKKVLVIA